MKLGLESLKIIDPDQVWLAFSPEDEKQAWALDEQYSFEAAYWNAFLNRISLNAFVTWIKEYLECKEMLEVLPNYDECVKLWEFVNGTAIQLGETRIVLIPSEGNDVEEFCVQQEWIDIPSWVASYYLAVQVNPDNNWLRILGYTTHKTLKHQGKYDKITRTYSLARTQLIADLNLMWMARELCLDEKAVIEPLPKLSPAEAKSLMKKLRQPSLCSPRLDVEFEKLGAILGDQHFRQQLCNLLPIPVLSAKVTVNLSGWFQRMFEPDWQPLEEFLGLGGAKIAFATRSKEQFRKPVSDQTAAIPALIELLHFNSDEETRLKAAECLGAIAPGNADAIATLISLLHTSQDKWTRYQAAIGLGRIGTGNLEAIAALTTLLHTSKDDHLLWQAALSLGEIDPNHPQAGIGRVRQIDLGMQLAGCPIALLVAIRPETDQEVGIFLRVYPTEGQSYLPLNLQLTVLDGLGKVFDQAQARSQDNWIQLQLSCQVGDFFSVKVALGETSHIEEFIC